MAKICFMTAFFPPHKGGVERYTYELSRQMNKLGYDILIVTSRTKGTESEEKSGGISILRMPVFNLMNGRLPVPKKGSALNRIKRNIEKWGPDIFITNMRIYPISLMAANIASELGKHSFLIEHISGRLRMKDPVRSYMSGKYETMFTDYLKKKITRFYGVSGACEDWLAEYGIKSSGVIPNGIDPDSKAEPELFLRKYDLPGDAYIISFAGRLLPEKGATKLLKAFNALSGKYENLFLAIAGGGPDYNELKNEIAGNDRIILTGEIEHNEVMSMLSASKIAVLPGDYPEGLPTIILEGGISGCAIAVTPMGGAKEIIEDRKTGLIIEGSSVDKISDTIKIYLMDEDFRRKMSENLQERILEEFSWDKIAGKLAVEIESILH